MVNTLDKLNSYNELTKEEMVDTNGGGLIITTIFGVVKVKTLVKWGAAAGAATGAAVMGR